MAIEKLLNIPFETNVLYEEGSSSSGHGFGNVPAESISLLGGEAETVVDADGVSVGGAKVSFPKEGGEFATSVIEKTWAELRAMKVGGELVPGQQYRITDYVATVANDPSAQSANHPFDLIVVADSESKLNEKARAIRHTGDTYFPASVKFEAWQVWYCLDNDTNRFAWADATNGKGIIYRLIDEWRNDCPYDFKGIQFARWEMSNPVGYIFDFANNEWVEDTEGKLAAFLNVKTGLYGLSNYDDTWEFGYDSAGGNGRFKIEYTVSDSPSYLFTFGSLDYSVLGMQVRENVIRPVFNGSKLWLNNISFLNTSNSSSSCQSNAFGSGCYSSTFGDDCSDNTFGSNCSDNTFGDDCYSNTFGYGCQSNTFGDNCYSNTFGYGCQSNTFGDNCYSNAFGSNCYFNTFGYGYQSNTFGYGCQSNTFGNDCYSNTFGNECDNNTFGNDCYSNTFGDSCSDNTFGDDPSAPRSYFQFITFEPGVNGVLLDCPSTSDAGYCRNITVAKGVNSIYITVPDVDQLYKTTYEASGSQTIDVSTL